MHRPDERDAPSAPSVQAGAKRPTERLPATRKMLQEHARQIRFSREMRRTAFDQSIFGEPAWDILLALYIIDIDQRRLNTRQVATMANQPLTTSLRWLDYLEAQGLVSRHSNPFDQRMIFVELSDKGRTAMDTYLMNLHHAEILAPKAVSQ